MSRATLLEPIANAIADASREATGAAAPATPLGPPARREHGDLASPVAMTLAKSTRRSPREIAEAMGELLGPRGRAEGWLDAVEVAGPGFLNLRMSPAWFAESVHAVASAGARYGAGQAQPVERILLEYVSANPTGPPHVGHARHAAYGDSLARILRFAGHRVDREYYVNDHGRQMRLFGASVAARYAQLLGIGAQLPEEGYSGEYVTALAERIRSQDGDAHRDAVAAPGEDTLRMFSRRGEELMLASIRSDLAAFRVEFDTFFSERSLHEDGRVAAGLAALERAGDAYRAEDALWFRTSRYGDEKDRVLVRGDGETTYLASDVAYHLEKAARGHDRLIDVLGADHHGYVARLRAVLAAAGHDPGRLEVVIMQLVSLLERGEAKRMSKRAGTLVLLSELVQDIGVDAARFFLVQRSHDTPLELDLQLAREQSQENPVYYVQYAHARACSILAQVPETRRTPPSPPPALDEAERALVLRLAEWPQAVREAEQRRAPHRVIGFLIDLARDFHAFYHRCRVVGEEPAVEAFRLELTRAVRSNVALASDLVGVEAPERM